MTTTIAYDTSKAKAFFAAKIAYTLGPIELDHRLREGDDLVVVDVRAVEDFAKGHIPGAINLPEEQWPTAEGLRKESTNVLYCYNEDCHLAATVAVRWAGEGYPVMEMSGGFDAWKENGLTVES
ncbi:MAG TPA: rhodanese-like domain-containing protein [Candidatus Limnocylindria bacterium]|jgi:rhodanese-related sulfurtransferase|nr:rhodanese-like domain-containing protein [Candidatus Limnocylindria bacterium]